MTDFTLADLERRVAERARVGIGGARLRALIDKGVAHCAKKFGEEAFETAIAAVQEDKSRLVSETADVLYHLMVLLKARGIARSDVEAELQKRTAQSGLAVKAARPRG